MRLLFMVFFSSLFIVTGGASLDLDAFWEREFPFHPIADPLLANEWKDYIVTEGQLSFIVELRDKNIKRQWVVSIGESEIDKENNHLRSQVFYSSTGEHFEFSTEMKSLKLQTFGPLVLKREKLSKRRSNLKEIVEQVVDVPDDFLSLGFYDMASLSMKMESMDKPALGLLVGAEPYDDYRIVVTKSAYEHLAMTSAEIRSVIGLAPSTNSFFNLLMATPGLSDIMKKLIDRPSVFSLLGQGVNLHFSAKGKGVKAMDPEDWGLSRGDFCYQMPMVVSLNDKRALEILLIITSPHGLYQNSAGVVGVVAFTPGDYERVLFVKIFG